MGGLELVAISDDNQIARSRAVTVRDYDADFVEALTGLTGGEQVVIDRTGPIAEGTILNRN
jgi:hypothetical protein